MEKRLSVYDLSVGYIKLFRSKENLSPEDKKQIIQDFNELLSTGWTAQEIARHLKLAAQNKDVTAKDIRLFFQNKKMVRTNLLIPNKMYYHNELRITSKPPVIDYDYDTGEYVRKVEDYFLEMRASYTLEELTNYFKRNAHLYIPEIMNDCRLKGALKWLTQNYDIEMVLFMIDIAENQIAFNDAPPLKNPSNLHEYFLNAKASYECKMNQCRLSGGAKIVPRKRGLHG